MDQNETPVEETSTNPVKKFFSKKATVIASAAVGLVAVTAATVALRARNAADSYTVTEPDLSDEE